MEKQGKNINIGRGETTSVADGRGRERKEGEKKGKLDKRKEWNGDTKMTSIDERWKVIKGDNEEKGK